MKNQTVIKKKGFSFLSFLIGILFGIIIILGAIGGAVAYVLLADIDDLLGLAGFENKDGEGNYVYINTDEESGGAENALGLIKTVVGMCGQLESLTVGEVENLLPVVSTSVVDPVVGMLSEYVEVDAEKLRSTPFSEFAGFVVDTAMDIEPASILEQLGVQEGGSILLDVLLYGAEADYVEYGGVSYALWYDEYSFDGSDYLRADGVSLPVGLEVYLGGSGEDSSRKIFFYLNGADAFVVYETDGVMTATDISYTAYSADAAECTGNYYYDNAEGSGEKVKAKPVTVRMLANPEELFSILDNVEVLDVIGGDGLTRDVLAGITLGDLLAGNVDFDEMLDTLTLDKFIDVEMTFDADGSPETTTTILAYMVYGLTDLQFDGESYFATYKDDQNLTHTALIGVENGVITDVRYVEEGEEKEVAGTPVGDISSRINGLTTEVKIGQLINIDESNAVLYRLKDSTVSSLSGDIAALTINEIYADEIYVGGGKLFKAVDVVSDSESQIAFDATYVYYIDDGSGKLVLAGGDGKLAALPAEGVYYTYGPATALWKLMLSSLVDVGGEKIMTEQSYSINQITDMINNVTVNIEISTLYDLSAAGILTIAPETLDMVVKESVREEYGITYFGELTLEQMISVLSVSIAA